MVKRLPTMPWVPSLGREFPLEKAMAPHSSTLTWKRRSLVGYSPWGHKELDTILYIHELQKVKKTKTSS